MQPYTLDDFRKHFQNIQKMGMMNRIAQMPGMSEMVYEGESPDVTMERVFRIIDAMSPDQRADPKTIDAMGRERIAKDAGVQSQEVSDFLKQFESVQALMEQMMNMTLWQRIKMVTGLGRFPRLPPPRP
jgi:signal recognition particle subunit SRP54